MLLLKQKKVTTQGWSGSNWSRPPSCRPGRRALAALCVSKQLGLTQPASDAKELRPSSYQSSISFSACLQNLSTGMVHLQQHRLNEETQPSPVVYTFVYTLLVMLIYTHCHNNTLCGYVECTPLLGICVVAQCCTCKRSWGTQASLDGHFEAKRGV